MTSISPTSSNDIQSPLTVCTSLKSGKQFISKTGECNERIYEARDWYRQGAVPTGTPGSKLIALNLCTSKKSQIRVIREKCNPRTQYSDTYQRSYGPPAAPLVPTATAGLLGSALLSFAAPAVDGGALVTSYTITSNPGAIISIIAPKDINRAKITGLTPGVTYTFSITATNSQGESLASPSSEAMLAPNLPDAPSITSLILTGDTSARLHYDHTTFDGGAAITSYKAIITSSGLVVATRQVSPGVLELTGLPYSTTLSISLSARNVAGSSLASNASNSITTATPPPPPPEPEPSPTSSSSADPSLAAPAFTLSSSTEDGTVNTAATGFTIASTGGVIASFTISPAAPGGMSFNTSTGGFSGTPTATQSATTYTITATNATGSTTQTFSFTVSAAVISVAAIGGVTAPVINAAPVTRVTSANGYTGTVTWSGSPTRFAASTSYTATITLTAAVGYTLTGVSENFFTVAGATSVTHSENSGVITAVFPATESFGLANRVSITRAFVGTERRTAFSTQPQISVQDSGGNTVTSSDAVITATVSSGGTLIGTTSATASSGVATFNNLGIDGTIGTSYIITFTTGDLTAATATVTLSGTTCDGSSFTCQVGDTGPGGGTIFYVALTPFVQNGAVGSMCTTCKYLEAAPQGWLFGDTSTDFANGRTWAQSAYKSTTVNNRTSPETATATAIGWGYWNTRAIILQGNSDTATSAAALADSHTVTISSVVYDDWYLPSKDELNQMCKWVRGVAWISDATVCTGGTNDTGLGASGFVGNLRYWSSSEASSTSAWTQSFGKDQFFVSKGTSGNLPTLRPVRAFYQSP